MLTYSDQYMFLSFRQDAKKHKSELEAFRGGKEDTFLEAETESIMISSDLDETHSFYKSQLDALKMELSRARFVFFIFKFFLL